ncbi:SLC13 family permease [Candidatus Poriferisocius sp.]|uniref:SLC13 family permease n=1 Tax=Candidatus Poriferisocius sp. TaxID=3101276 RepID=UPI003B025A18
MDSDAVLTVVVLVAMGAGLISNRLSPAAGVLGATGGLFLLGVIDADSAFSGFGNPAPVTIGALYVVAGAVTKTNALQPLVARVLDRGSPTRVTLIRLLAPAGAASAFLANTPIVAMLVPAVRGWAERYGRAASRFLIPLSYATILGGAITAIGTSTNLVLGGLLQSVGQDELEMFELARFGLPLAGAGLVLIVVAAPWLLPDRRDTGADGTARPYLVSMHVVERGAFDGQSVEAGGLRHLQGVFLVEVERQGTVIAPVAPTFVLRGGDRLTFAGRVDLVLDLQAMSGLTSAEDTHLEAVDSDDHTFFEAVVGVASPLSGRTLAEAGFRGRYQAAVVGIHRSGAPVEAKFGQVRLRPGDTLLVLAADGFDQRWSDHRDFLLVSRLGGSPPRATRRAPVALLAVVALVVLPAAGVLSVLKASLIAAGTVVLGGVLTPREAREAVDFGVLITIGAAFGLGAALDRVGLAEDMAGGIVTGFDFMGDAGVVLGIVVATMLLTELITNVAAVALVFPVALEVAAQAGLDPRTLALGVAVAASASFLTPIGYQTNTMVYGPGRYRFTDYLRLGVPMSMLTMVLLTVLVTTAA